MNAQSNTERFKLAFLRASEYALNSDKEASIFLSECAKRCESEAGFTDHVIKTYHEDEENKDGLPFAHPIKYVAYWHSRYLFLQWLRNIAPEK
jgi:hypothetical protein